MLSTDFKRIFKIAITVGIIFLLIYIIVDNYNAIRQYDYYFHFYYLIASFVVLLIAILILPIIWYFITRTFNCHLDFFESIKMRLISEIGKYIPGRVFGYGYLILHYKEAGKDQVRVLHASIYELVVSTFSAFLFFTIIFLFIHFQILDKFKIGFILVSLLGIISLHPWFFQKISDFFCRILKKEKIEYQISFPRILKILTLYLLFWIIFGLAFFFFVRAFTNVRFADISYLSGSFAISTFAGFMVFFLPAGLGAREGLLIYLMGIMTGNALAIVISIGSRIWLILGDLILFLIALSSKAIAKKKSKHLDL